LADSVDVVILRNVLQMTVCVSEVRGRGVGFVICISKICTHRSKVA